MDWNQIANAWRQDLVAKLQEHYGLAEEEARKKAEVWLEWLSRQPTLAERRSNRRPRRQPSSPRPAGG
jgi:hypothetical protein